MAYIHRYLPRRGYIRRLIDLQYDGNLSAAARDFGIRKGTLHDILSGRREGREETLRKIADVLRVPFLEMVDTVDREAA